MTLDHRGCILGIVGSRDVAAYAAESHIQELLLSHKPRVVVSGGAKGADTIAMDMARRLVPNTMRIVFRPTVFRWDVDKPNPQDPVEAMNAEGDLVITIDGGFKQRDEKIAEMSECLARIASTTSKTYGSGWTADHAEALGRRVVRFTVPGI